MANFFGFELESGTGVITLEDDSAGNPSILLLETQPIPLVGTRNFQDPAGNPISFGNLEITLQEDVVVGNNQICAGIVVNFPLDINGNIAAVDVEGDSAYSGAIWPGVYQFRVYTAEGQLVWSERVNVGQPPSPPPASPLTIITNFVPSGVRSFPYVTVLLAANGTTPYFWTLVSGSLPTGLVLTLEGTIFGTPTSVGNYNFIVEVTDSSTPIEVASKAFAMSINSIVSTLEITTTSLPGYGLRGN